MSARLARTYSDARHHVLAAAEVIGAPVESTPHPLTGPEGEALSVDTLTIGDPAAPVSVVVVSGTHGVEGFCGSAIQRHLLEQIASGARSVPDGVCLRIVHALNPYGFAWVRRVNEDNVDLNRNFVDWSQPRPHNVEYDALADLLVPDSWDETTQNDTTGALVTHAMEIGMDRMQEIVSGGQYHHPTGVFYGGTEPVWSHRWLRDWSATALATSETVVILDLHTGLGPWGEGEIIVSESTSSATYARAAQWWGVVASMVDGDSVSAPLAGDWMGAAAGLAPHAEVTGVAIEYGTVDPITVLQSLRADAWLHAHGDRTGPDAAHVRAQVRAAFADDDPAWIAACIARFEDVFDGAIAAVTR